MRQPDRQFGKEGLADRTRSCYPQLGVWRFSGLFGIGEELLVQFLAWTQAGDITYIAMRRGFVYLVAIVDWYSRRELAWRLSSMLTTDFCIEALEEAITRYGTPEIFNADQGSQFTRAEFTGVLKGHDIQISMDGKGCWRDNVFVERLWRTI